MDIEAVLEQGHNKDIVARIVDHVGNDTERFKVLMHILLNGTPRMVQRAAWPVELLCTQHPELVTPHFKTMLGLLEKPVHKAVYRNVIRTFQFCALPKKFHGELIGTIFSWVLDPAKRIAPRASAITVGLRLVELYPDLTQEFMVILEELLRNKPGPALFSRATKATKVLSKNRLLSRLINVEQRTDV